MLRVARGAPKNTASRPEVAASVTGYVAPKTQWRKLSGLAGRLRGAKSGDKKEAASSASPWPGPGGGPRPTLASTEAPPGTPAVHVAHAKKSDGQGNMWIGCIVGRLGSAPLRKRSLGARCCAQGRGRRCSPSGSPRRFRPPAAASSPPAAPTTFASSAEAPGDRWGRWKGRVVNGVGALLVHLAVAGARVRTNGGSELGVAEQYISWTFLFRHKTARPSTSAEPGNLHTGGARAGGSRVVRMGGVRAARALDV